METEPLDAWLSLGSASRDVGDQFEKMADMAKKVAALQHELNVITRMNEYVIEEMEP